MTDLTPTELMAIASEWSHWAAAPAPSVPRDVVLPVELRPDLVLAIQGVRRCGKSTLMTQLMHRYQLDRSRCMFVNFEDPRLARHLDFSDDAGEAVFVDAAAFADGLPMLPGPRS